MIRRIRRATSLLWEALPRKTQWLYDRSIKHILVSKSVSDRRMVLPLPLSFLIPKTTQQEISTVIILKGEAIPSTHSQQRTFLTTREWEQLPLLRLGRKLERISRWQDRQVKRLILAKKATVAASLTCSPQMALYPRTTYHINDLSPPRLWVRRISKVIR